MLVRETLAKIGQWWGRLSYILLYAPCSFLTPPSHSPHFPPLLPLIRDCETTRALVHHKLCENLYKILENELLQICLVYNLRINQQTVSCK